MNRFTPARILAALLALALSVVAVAPGAQTVRYNGTPATSAISATTLTTNGDLLTRAAGVPSRLAVGSTGATLGVVSGAPAWSLPSTLAALAGDGIALGDLVAPHCALGASDTVGGSTSAYLDVSGTPTAAPTLANGQSLVILFHAIAVPTGAEVLAAHMDSGASTRGWILFWGYESGSRGAASFFRLGNTGTGADGTIPLPSADVTGLLGVPHVLAFSLPGGAIHYSFDGGTVHTISAPSGSYVPTSSADPFRVGQLVETSDPAASSQVVALRTYSTTLSDADLVAVCAYRSSYVLAPASSGTITFDFHARQLVGFTTAVDRAGGQRLALHGAYLPRGR